MFVETTRFKVVPKQSKRFERNQDYSENLRNSSRGFVSFTLMKSNRVSDHILYVSQVVWLDYSAYMDWSAIDYYIPPNDENEAPVLLETAELEYFNVVALK